MMLASGYDRSKAPEKAEYREMTVGEAKRLRVGERVEFRSVDGTARDIKVNGAPKTWKRRPGVRVPVKYGLYECGYAEGDGEDDTPVSLLVVRL